MDFKSVKYQSMTIYSKLQYLTTFSIYHDIVNIAVFPELTYKLKITTKIINQQYFCGYVLESCVRQPNCEVHRLGKTVVVETVILGEVRPVE